LDQKTKNKFIIQPSYPCGGSSLRKGGIEIMLLRRLYKDDDRGLAEVLNES